MTALVSLIVKGTEAQVREALRKRGLSPMHVRAFSTDCVVEVLNAPGRLTMMQDWFEEVSDAAEPPYPAGTLLFFTCIRA